MSKDIRKVAVLGSGVMGIGIAAHLANCGIPVLMLDIVLPLSDEDKEKGVKETDPAHRNKLAVNALANAKKAKQPLAPLYVPENADLITPGNFEDDMEKIAECDWVIEVVLERLDIKKKVFAQVAEHWKPGMIVTSNTSGIPIKSMAEDMPKEMRKHFFVTHFFNPVRHMKLLEFILGEETNPHIVTDLAGFGERVLGKGIVYGKDTPNFVANRVGVYAIMQTIQHMQDMGLRIDEVDAIAGPAMGRPKSAAFRTADLVGLDTFKHVAMGCYEGCPDDPKRDVLKPPDWMEKMVENGWLGNKTKQGFYKKDFVDGKKKYFVLDYNSMEYVESTKPAFDSVKAAKKAGAPGQRVAKLIAGEDKAAEFAWKVMRDVTIYACERIPEITDDIVNLDNAMKWGFNWDEGPFETADAIGARELVKRMKDDGVEVPKLLDMAAKKGGFYKKQGTKSMYLDAADFTYKEVPRTSLKLDTNGLNDKVVNAVDYLTDPAAMKVRISDLRDAGKIIKSSAGATILDMGEGVALVEFHSYKDMNPVDDDVIGMLDKVVDEVKERGFIGVVVGNEKTNFSVGANLMMILMAARGKQWDNLEKAVKGLQDANMKIKYAPFPVVTAPAGMVMGGGCEVAMHGDAICAAAETYIGLVEVGVGVVPAGGGCKEYLIRNVEAAIHNNYHPNTFFFVAKAFENIMMPMPGKGLAMNAHEAMKLNILRPSDKITLNRDYLLGDAKQMVIGMHRAGYNRKSPRNDIKMAGFQFYAAFKQNLWQMRQGEYISDHDVLIGDHVAKILTGGDIPQNSVVSEQHILDLEREAFLSLCGTEKTQERMQYMLEKNKPLRN